MRWTRATEAILGPYGLGMELDPILPHWTMHVDPYVCSTIEVHSMFEYAVVRSLTHYVRSKLMAGNTCVSNHGRKYLSIHGMKTGNQEILDLLEASSEIDLPFSTRKTPGKESTGGTPAASSNPRQTMDMNKPIIPVQDSIKTKTGFWYKIMTSWSCLGFGRK